MYLMHGFGRVWDQKYVQTLRCLCFSDWNGQSTMSFLLYFLLRLSFVLFFFSQRSWWTPRQRRLISNGPSSQPPNPRCVIPAFGVSSVLLTRIVCRPGIFVGFQLFLSYFGYKRVPYTSANWQNKGRLERSWDSKWIGSRCFDLFRQPWSWSNRLCTFFFFFGDSAARKEADIFIKWSAEGWLLGCFMPAASAAKFCLPYWRLRGSAVPETLARRSLEPYRNIPQTSVCLFFITDAKQHKWAKWCVQSLSSVLKSSILSNKHCSMVFYYPERCTKENKADLKI